MLGGPSKLKGESRQAPRSVAGLAVLIPSFLELIVENPQDYVESQHIDDAFP